MSKRSADAVGVKEKAEEDASHRQRTADNTATPPAATSVAADATAAVDAAASTSSAEAAATVAASSIDVSHSSSSVRASAFDSLLSLRSECDESTLSHGLVARCLGEQYNKVWPILKAALQSNQPIDFGLLIDDVPVLSLFLYALPTMADTAELTELRLLLQRQLREWKARHDSGPHPPCGRSLLFRLLCNYSIPTSLSEAQIDLLEQIADTLLALDADMTAVGPNRRNTIAMAIAGEVGGQTLLARMLQTPCSGVWSSASMLTMVWHRNAYDQSLLGLLRSSLAPHDAVWKSNIAHVKSIRRFWSERVKPALTAALVSECGLVTDVAHMCLDYIDGVDRANIDRVPQSDADDDDDDDEVPEPEPAADDEGDGAEADDGAMMPDGGPFDFED